VYGAGTVPAALRPRRRVPLRCTRGEGFLEAMAKLKLDLHDVFNRGAAIDAELDRVLREAVAKRIPMVEIIPGKGSGQLKKRVLRYLDRPEVKRLYHRVEKDSRNFGRLFVHFRH
jgi:DNA-nicking Smr family endonuclease